MDFATLIPILGAIAGVLSPFITQGVKAAAALAGAKVPPTLKPVINVIAGAVIAGLCGADPSQGAVAALAAGKVYDVAKDKE